MARRTVSEIEKDFKKIREFVNVYPATSIKDISKELGLSESEIKTSLSRHPRIEEKILKQLEQNKEALNAMKKAEEEANRKKTLKAENTKKQVEKATDFVIDASITGLSEFKTTLYGLCNSKSKIILTSITIKELENMQKFKDIQSLHARHLLATAVENQDRFSTVLIDETCGTPDDCIIKYCADHKDTITLLTSDKAMALKARMYEVQVAYLKQTEVSDSFSKHKCNNKKVTLFIAKMVGDKLIIPNFTTPYRNTLVISNGIEYTYEISSLNVGDHVYVATNKYGYISFAHYEVTSLSAENNCRIIHSARLYNTSDIQKLPKAEYKSFVRDFKRSHNL